MVMLPRRNVLIFHLGALGDFVLTWPLAMGLARIYQQSRIIYVTHGQKGKLAEKVLHIESTDVEGGWHHLFGTVGDLPANARKMLEGAHSVFSFVANEGDAWSENIKAIAPEAQLIPLQPRPEDGDVFAGHVSEWLAGQLGKYPAIATAYQQMLRSVQSRGAGYKRSPEERVIAIHPGSGSVEKCWPVKNFVKLTRRLAKSRHHVRVLIGEVEKERIGAEDMGHFASVAEVVEPKDYVELLVQLGLASAVVCNDTGPGHLAGIIGTPTIALFGPTEPGRWKPLGPHVQTIRGEKIDSISVESVYDAAAKAAG
jgi:ADP-heptose:LPS heptosyltransferase